MRPFGVVILQVLIDPLLHDAKVAFLVVKVAKTLFSEDAIESFNEGLFVLFVRPCCSNARDMCAGILLPFSFKLRTSVTLDVINLPKLLKLSFEGFSASTSSQAL